MSKPHKTGTVASGDVTIFYRKFGSPGAAPTLILHGANYFDSADWQSVARDLADGREIAALDHRGFGESSWSPSKNYSNDANLEDIVAVLDHLGWDRAVIMGHSRGGLYATLFAAHFPERTAGLVLVDYCPGAGPAAGAQSVNNKPKVFSTIEALQAALSRDKNTPPGSEARARLENFIEPVDGGFIVSKRDPDFMNTVPLSAASWTPKYAAADLWAELAAVRAPVLALRGTRSDRFPAVGLERLQRDFAQIDVVDVDSGHDMAAAAPQAVVDAVAQFLKGHTEPAPLRT